MSEVFKKKGKLLDGFLSWVGTSLKQSISSYCEIQTADSSTCLVSNDGSLVSVIRIDGVMSLIGREEFEYIKSGLQQSLQSSMSKSGQMIQVYFGYDKDRVDHEIEGVFTGARDTAERIGLRLDDLFKERVENLSRYCSHEECFVVLWTKVDSLSKDQMKHAMKDKAKAAKQDNTPPFFQTQNIVAAVTALRESHES